MSFMLRVAGGATTDAEGKCSRADAFFRFSTQTASLERRGCWEGRHDHHEIALEREQVESIVATLRALGTTCDTACASDMPEMALVVRDCLAQIEGTYRDNGAGACPGMASPPFIAQAEVLALIRQLNDVVARSCEATDSAVPGACRPICRGGSTPL